jgi:protein-disulfide isomerase
MLEQDPGPVDGPAQIDLRARGFVPWYKQAGAWVVIGAVAVGFSAALVLVAGPGGAPAATGGGAASSESGGQSGPAASLTPSPTATDGARDQPAPVATAECPPGEATPTAEAGRPAGATDLGGIAFGCDGVPGGPVAEQTKVTVDVMSDYICPYCKRFEQEIGPQLDQAMRSGQIKLTLYPMGYLDAYSTTEYSSRAARAAVAVAGLDPDRFWDFDQLLWDNQPAEGGPGLSDQEIADLARQAGVGEDAIAQFAGGAYDDWVVQTTQVVVNSEGFQGTPWVLIGDGANLYPWSWSDGDLQTAIARVAAGGQP